MVFFDEVIVFLLSPACPTTPAPTRPATVCLCWLGSSRHRERLPLQISTGLDSATAFSVVPFLQDMNHSLNQTYMVNLLQPQPEVVALFDEVLLLTEGEVLYQ